MNNPRVLFSKIDSLINPAPKSHSFIPSTSRCEEFAAFFRDKITKIRLDLNPVILNVYKLQSMTKNAMNVFTAVDAQGRSVTTKAPQLLT